MRAREIFEAAGEMSLDDMGDFVEAWEENIDDNISNEHYVEIGDKGSYVHLFVGGYPEDGFSEGWARTLAEKLDADVRPHGWFVGKCEFKLYQDAFDDADPEGASSQIMCFIDVFPLHGDTVEVPDEVWHVCRAEDVASIQQHGLQPRSGGNDHIQTANGRIYVCTDQRSLQWIENDFAKQRGWRNLHVFKIDTESLDNEWHEDVEWQIASAWTPQPIPPEYMTHMGELRYYVIY